MKMANSVDDIVSLLVTIIAILYMLITAFRALSPKKRPTSSPEEEREQTLEEYLDSLEEEEEEKPVRKPVAKVAPRPQPLPVVAAKKVVEAPLEEKFEFHSKLEDFQQKTAIEDRKLAIHLRSPDELVSESLRKMTAEGAIVSKSNKCRIQALIRSLPQEQLLFLSYEVFHVPVSKRESPFPWNG